MTPQDTMRLALRALETGLELAEAHAEHTHTVYAGYYPERHKRVDTDVAEIKAAIEALKAALAQQPKFTNDLVEFVADALTVDKDHARALMSQALAQQGEQQPVAFDYQTAADFLNGKTINGELVSRFVSAARWAHDDNRSLRSVIQSLRGELAARDAEIAILKSALMDAEAAPAAQPDTWIDDGGWEFPIERQIIQTR